MRRHPLSSQQLLKDVAKLHIKDIDLGLERFQTLLMRLGQPHENLPPVIHVAGTNGKGSTIAYLQSIFEEAGYSVHTFTSPHLVNVHESITLAGQHIDEETFSSLLQEVITANAGAALTVFEAISAVAFLAFSRTKGHIVLLETGMGGAGDTTNVVKHPILCAITPISVDHSEFLGKTLTEIASHKAGIIKRDVPCVIAKQDSEVYQVIRDRSKALKAPLYRQGRDWFVKRTGRQMIFEGWDGDYAWPLPALAGEHQVDNAGLALACLEVLKGQHSLHDETIRHGLQHAYWPGRLEQVNANDFLSPAWQLWLDGGHNESAAKALRQQIKKWNDKPLYVICGMMKRKDSKAFFKEIGGLADHVYTVPIPDKDSKKPEKLANQVQDVGGQATACEDIELALNLIKAERKIAGRVLICGSLYLLGAFYALRART